VTFISMTHSLSPHTTTTFFLSCPLVIWFSGLSIWILTHEVERERKGEGEGWESRKDAKVSPWGRFWPDIFSLEMNKFSTSVCYFLYPLFMLFSLCCFWPEGSLTNIHLDIPMLNKIYIKAVGTFFFWNIHMVTLFVFECVAHLVLILF